jgi:hypothetical protein
MVSRLSSLVVVAVVSGAFVAGCGSSSSSSTPSASSTSAPSGAASTSGSGGGSSASSNPAVQQAVAACKASVGAAPTLSADEKTKLTTLCDKAASGDVAGVQKIAAQVCRDVAKSLPASAQSTALAACPKT